MNEVRFMTCDPGHFHAALVHKEMPPGAGRRVHVYAPLGPDLLAHLARLHGFNTRKGSPTAWEVELHAGPGHLQRMLAERPGNVVVLSGRNRGKIDAILASLKAGLHVLADKPWVIRADDLPKLDEALALARERGLVAMDMMTERHEVTNRLMRALIADREVFGEVEPGTRDHPAVTMESEHFLIKTVAGAPLSRPAWWFDVDEAGEGLGDVGTHLVDLVPWLLFPGEEVGPGQVEVLRAGRTPTAVSRADFRKITGEADFPAFLSPDVVSAQLLYYGNTTVTYSVRGVHVWLNVSWGLESARGDRHACRIAGGRSSIEVRHEDGRPEVYVVPRETSVGEALGRFVAAAQGEFPGATAVEAAGAYRVEVPAALRVGHEAHFAEVMRAFLRRLGGESPGAPANMLAKYHVTTRGVAMARG